MEQGGGKNGIDIEGLRQRNVPQHFPSVEEAKGVVRELNAETSHARDGHPEGKKTFGRTPDGNGEFGHLLQALPSIAIQKGLKSSQLS